MTATDKQSVDPELHALVDAFPPIDLSADTLGAFREAFVQMSPLPDPATHADVRIDTVRVPGGDAGAGVRCLLFRPAAARGGGAMLHIHGGGFVMGSPEMDVPRNIELVRATGCTILSVDYRLAPEHPHPAGLEDCHAALTWLAAEAGAPMGVIGESAGGGLAASLALMARERGPVPLACQVLVYPMLVPPEASVDAVTPDARTGRFIWSRASNAFAWSAFLGANAARESIAGLATDLAGLPPAFIAVGDLDLFVHDNLHYASRLLRAGVPVEAHLYAGAIHGFDRATDAAVSQRFTAGMVAFIRRHLGA